MGQPKLLLPFRGRSLVMNAVMAALDVSEIAPVVVTGGYDELVKKELQGINAEIVFNPDWKSGMASSIQTGLRQAMKNPELKNILIVLADQPYVSASLFLEIVDQGIHKEKDIIASRYADGTLGTPALFKKSMFSELLSLSGQEGARKIVRSQPDRMETVDFPLGGIDIDTPGDYTNLLNRDGTLI
jgi:molybdenum cofactor cytidylyltransferase